MQYAGKDRGGHVTELNMCIPSLRLYYGVPPSMEHGIAVSNAYWSADLLQGNHCSSYRRNEGQGRQR